VIVQIRVQVRTVELLDAVGMGTGNIAIAHMFADDSAILGFRQPIIVGMPRPASGLLDH
jgi:hypothetical protein